MSSLWLRAWTRFQAKVGSIKKSARRPERRARPEAEHLEDRCLLNVASFVGPFRTIDGTGNNLSRPERFQWGSTNEQLVRRAPAEYADGIDDPVTGRPGPRVVSNAIVAHERDSAGVQEEIINDRNLSNYSYVWGQFLDHDLDLTQPPTTGRELLPIIVPAGDEFFTPGSVIPFSRSRFDPATGTSRSNPRQQINQITAWIDASNVYGSDAATAASLRTFQDGKLKTTVSTSVRGGRTEVLLPVDANGFFLAGDVRANENIELTSLHTLFVREHNRLATEIKRANPRLTDEQIYQRARAYVGAEMQVITFGQWLPSLIGNNALRPYRGYNPNVNAGIANEFSTASFRVHSLINDDIEFFGNDGRAVREGIELREGFSNPDLVREEGVDTLLKYVASASAEEVDNQIVDGLRNFLLDPPGQLDLASLNIQRGRDHGLADYNRVRVAYGLRPVTRFSDITDDPEVQEMLRELYGNVNNIDLWVGGLAEDHVPGASFGPTIRAVLVDQFERLRDGDRFWYQRIFSGSLLAELENTTLADIILRNSTVTTLQDNVFFLKAQAHGQVFFDRNGNGERDGFEVGIPGVLVQLLNDEGDVVAETRTNSQGRYSFVNEFQETGDFQVQVVVPSVLRVTTENPEEFLIDRGDRIVRNLDFGIRLADRGAAGSFLEEYVDILTALLRAGSEP